MVWRNEMQQRALTVLVVIFALSMATFPAGASQSTSPKNVGICSDVCCMDCPPEAPPASGAPNCQNTDGRENSVCDNPTETAVLYCKPDGSITVYGYVAPPGN